MHVPLDMCTLVGRAVWCEELQLPHAGEADIDAKDVSLPGAQRAVTLR